jgi:hypothetical protein
MTHTKDEALKLALEALEDLQRQYSIYPNSFWDWSKGRKAITTLTQALAEPVQEPEVWPDGLIDRIKAAEQRIQDGHALRRIPADPTDVDLVLAEVRYLLEGKQPPFWIDTTPPAAQRQWVGLTDEEREQHRDDWRSNIHDKEFRAIEAKLKEKNAAAQPAPEPLTDDQIDKAAMKLAECMDYPWAQMPEKGKQAMRNHAKAVIEAAAPEKGQP